MSAVLCGWAAIGSNGSIKGDKAGDQNGRETKIGSYYQFKQTTVVRWNNRKYAKKYAKIIKMLCIEFNIGYDQNERITAFNAFKNVGWKMDKVSKDTPLEIDCSELVALGVNLTFGELIIPSYAYTGNLNELLMNTGKFKKLTGSKYLVNSDYLMEGDIVNAPGHHVISVLEDGPLVLAKDASPKVAEPTLKKGSTGSEVKKLQSNLNELKITDASGKSLKLDGIFGASTKEALRKFQKKYNLEVDGIYGNNSANKMKTLIE